MIVEAIAFAGCAFAATALIAKAYQRHQDVLYGPYIQGRSTYNNLLLSNILQFIAATFSSFSWRVRGLVYLTTVIT
jgi:hypothetical protein